MTNLTQAAQDKLPKIINIHFDQIVIKLHVSGVKIQYLFEGVVMWEKDVNAFQRYDDNINLTGINGQIPVQIGLCK